MRIVQSASKLRPTSARNDLEAEKKIVKGLEKLLDKDDYDLQIDELLEDSMSFDVSDKNKSKSKKPETEQDDQKKTNEEISKNQDYFKVLKKNIPLVKDLLGEYSKINVKENIKTQAADVDSLDVFDRSQRTRSATLAQIGDHQYYSPFQRIGQFMDYSQQLHLADLLNIEKVFLYSKNSISYLNSKKTGYKRAVQFGQFSEFMSDPNSLFHGFMRYEGFMEQYYIDLSQSGSLNTYDPVIFLTKNNSYYVYDPSTWNEEFRKDVIQSINNYNKYIQSDQIRIDDICAFKMKEKKDHIIRHIKFGLLKNKLQVEALFQEIEEFYYFTMKNSIMEYILRSPFERKRLNITYFPKKCLPSSITIAYFGSFNRGIYGSWVDSYHSAVNNLNKNLSICNLVMSSLCDWTSQFKSTHLYYLSNLKRFAVDHYTIHLDEFEKAQSSYLAKIFNYMNNIYYRGAMLILRKYKYLQRKHSKEGKWTLKGYIAKERINEVVKQIVNTSSYDTNPVLTTQGNEFNYSDAYFGMDFYDELDDFWTNVTFDDFVDIRINPAYYAYIHILKKNKLDLSVNEYEILPVEEKLKINQAVTTYVTVFFREIVDKSIKDFTNFFFSFKYVDDLIKEASPEELYDLNSGMFIINCLYYLYYIIYFIRN